jgi:hypothetical protein
MAGFLRQQPQNKKLQIDGGQFSAHAEGSAAHFVAHEPPAQVTETAAPMTSAEEKMDMMMHFISRYVVKRILR